MVDLTKHMKKGLVEQKPGQILAFAAYTNKIPDIHGNGSGNPAPSARTGRTENHRHHRTPYFIGERFRSDPRA